MGGQHRLLRGCASGLASLASRLNVSDPRKGTSRIAARPSAASDVVRSGAPHSLSLRRDTCVARGERPAFRVSTWRHRLVNLGEPHAQRADTSPLLSTLCLHGPFLQAVSMLTSGSSGALKPWAGGTRPSGWTVAHAAAVSWGGDGGRGRPPGPLRPRGRWPRCEGLLGVPVLCPAARPAELCRRHRRPVPPTRTRCGSSRGRGG